MKIYEKIKELSIGGYLPFSNMKSIDIAKVISKFVPCECCPMANKYNEGDKCMEGLDQSILNRENENWYEYTKDACAKILDEWLNMEYVPNEKWVEMLERIDKI